MPNDIDKMVDEFLEEMDTLPWPAPEPEVWTVIGADADGDPGELEAVIEALETASPSPWYEKLVRELDE
jgi:hypothetical protein